MIKRIPWEVLERIDGRRGGRFYKTPDGILIPSVTTILGVIAKPALIGWAAKTEREMVLEAAANLYLDLPEAAPKMKRDAFVRTLEQRIGQEKAHQRIAREAADIGSQAHKLIEWNLHRELGHEVGPEPHVEPAAASAFAAFQSWWWKSDLKPLRIEQMIFHPGDLYAGTADMLAKRGDEIVLVDFKTSKAIYLEYVLQVAAYAEAVNAMGHGPVTQGVIVRFPKGTYDTFNPQRDIQEVQNIKELYKVFKQAMSLWTWLQMNDPNAAAPKPVPAVHENEAAGNGAAETVDGAGGGDALPAAQKVGGRRRARPVRGEARGGKPEKPPAEVKT